MNTLTKLVSKYLKETAEKIDNGSCELTQFQAIDILSVVAHEAMSKETACEYLNMSRSYFDLLVSKGSIPKGRKRRGFKELVWYRDELDRATYKAN